MWPRAYSSHTLVTSGTCRASQFHAKRGAAGVGADTVIHESVAYCSQLLGLCRLSQYSKPGTTILQDTGISAQLVLQAL
jgi:hypothetical protein